MESEATSRENANNVMEVRRVTTMRRWIIPVKDWYSCDCGCGQSTPYTIGDLAIAVECSVAVADNLNNDKDAFDKCCSYKKEKSA